MADVGQFLLLLTILSQATITTNTTPDSTVYICVSTTTTTSGPITTTAAPFTICMETTTTSTSTSSSTTSTATSTTSTASEVTTTTTTTSAALLTTPEFPLSETEALVASVMVSLGCTALLISLGITMAIYLLLMDFSVERLLHMGQELMLFVGHILVLTMRDRVDIGLGCKLASMIMQYCFIGAFAFMALEALQAFCILSNVTSNGGLFGLSRPTLLLIGAAVPVVPTGITAAAGFHHYPSVWSCWLNLGHKILLSSFIPIILFTLVSVVLVEAAGMEGSGPVPGASTVQRSAAQYLRVCVAFRRDGFRANTKGLLFLLPLNIMSWFFGSKAVYAANIALYSTVFLFNLLLGIAIFTFHSLGNPRVLLYQFPPPFTILLQVHAIFKKLLHKCCPKKKTTG